MKKLFFTASLAAILSACNSTPAAAAPYTTPGPQTIGYDSYNPTATAHLHAMLGKTATAAISINDKVSDLTSTETAELLALLKGAKSATTLCAPADCFYLNLQTAEGEWLMSLPVQKTQQGIVLLYLKLQGNQAGVPLQNWWSGVSNRLGL
jgi:hypothetical protein